jgi:diguanylate cyclase (GGDEF)-like protein
MCLLTVLSGVELFAQQYSFRSFGVTEGLTNLVIRRIYQDRVGFLWVSTEDGIFRYDGDRFEAFGAAQGIPMNSGAAFGDAPDGSLLAGGAFGLYHLSGNSFEKISGPFSSVNWAQGIASDGKGHTYVGTDAGLMELYLQPGRPEFGLRAVPRPAGVTGKGDYGVLVDGDVLWYGCGEDLCRRDGDGTRVFGQESGLPDREIIVIQRDRGGNLWVRVRNAGVFERLAGQAKFSRPVVPFSPASLGGVPSVDSEGWILLPSPKGLLMADEKGWQNVDRSRGLSGTVYAAFEDRQHSLWIGLAGRGLVQWRGYKEWESFSTESGLDSDLVYEILPRGAGSIWVGTEAGLYLGEPRLKGMAFKRVTGLGPLPVHSLQRALNGDLWIGTETRGVARIDARSGKAEWFGEAQGLAGKAAYVLRFDRGRRLWAATEAGLFVATPPYRTFARVAELPSTRMWAVAEGTDETIWAGGREGLFELAGGRWRNVTAGGGLSNKEVLSLGAGPNGVVWVGYRFGGGIDRVQPRAGGVAIEKGVQRPGTDGLVYFLDFDAAGRLWAGTEKGVDVWDGARWSHYDMSDGLAWNDCNLNAFAAEPDGTVWIGTGAGLSRFKARPREASDIPLAVAITRLTMGSVDLSRLRHPTFGVHAGSLVVRYAALNASRQNGVVFRYRLGGASLTWTETSQRELQFANLAPGAYQLQVDARESDGAWSLRPAEFQFRILPPWYLTWWFAGLSILIPVSIALAVAQVRQRNAGKRERELKSLVEEKTVDLRRVNEELLRLSFVDPLTGLTNRRMFEQSLVKEWSRLNRSSAVLSLLSIDVDQFKALNDSQGHMRGDEYLVRVAKEMGKFARRTIDVAARCGGEEFALILPGTDAAGAAQVAESIRRGVADLKLPHPASGVVPFLTVSVGVATATGDSNWSRVDLMAAADRALYAAKNAGRNCVRVAVSEVPVEKAE